jgi:hypothetical protein
MGTTIVPVSTALLAGALLGGTAQLVLWLAAVVIEGIAVRVTSRGGAWRLPSATQFSERRTATAPPTAERRGDPAIRSPRTRARASSPPTVLMSSGRARSFDPAATAASTGGSRCPATPCRRATTPGAAQQAVGRYLMFPGPDPYLSDDGLTWRRIDVP